MNAVIGAGFSLLRGAGSPLLVLGLLVSVAARLPAGTVLPLKPEFRVVDMAEVIPPRREQVLAGDLQALFENEKISIHVVMLGNKPDIMLNQIARHLFAEWSDAPICGMVIAYPGYPEQFEIVAGGSGVPEGARVFIKRAIVQSMQVGKLERDQAMCLVAAATSLADTLRGAKADIERYKDDSEYGRIDTRRVPLGERFPLLRPDTFRVVTVISVVLVALTFFGVRFRARRPLRFPEVIPRRRYGGKFSGGNNTKVVFEKRRSGN